MLTGKNIKLRAIEESDLNKIYEWRFSYENYDYFYEYPIVNKEQNKLWFESTLKNHNEVNFAVESSGQLIGIVSLINIDYRNRKAEMGRVLLGETSFRGKGFGNEMINLLLEYAYKHLNLRKIYCEVFEKNTKALDLYKSLGFIQEGILKEHIFKNGKYENIIILAKIGEYNV